MYASVHHFYPIQPRWYLIVSIPDLCTLSYFYQVGSFDLGDAALVFFEYHLWMHTDGD